MFYVMGQDWWPSPHEDVLSAEFPQQKMDSFTDENFETLSGVRHQITNVSFDNALVRSLNGLWYYPLYLDYTYEGKEIPERALKDAA